MLDKPPGVEGGGVGPPPETFVKSRSFGRTKKEGEGADVVIEDEKSIGTSSKEPGSYVSKEPGSYNQKQATETKTSRIAANQIRILKRPDGGSENKTSRIAPSTKTTNFDEMKGPIRILQRPKENSLQQQGGTSSVGGKSSNSTPLTDRFQKRRDNRVAKSPQDKKPLKEDVRSAKPTVPVKNPLLDAEECEEEEIVESDRSKTSRAKATPDSMSKVANKKKLLRKKEKEKPEVKLDRDNDYLAGSLFTRQWPKINHIFECKEFVNLLEEDALVSEKLDGSNMAISSRNYITSRRNILLRKPSEIVLSKFKFSGQKMTKVMELMPKVQQLHDRFCKLFPFLDLETFLYGELIQAGTSTSKDDKYKYRDHGYQAGDLVAFGCGISFDDQLDCEQMSMAKKHLKSQGFNVQLSEDNETNTQYFVLLMNDVLEKLLTSVGVPHVIKYRTLTLEKALEEYCGKLQKNDIEGIVLAFDAQIYKWKGVEENYPPAFCEAIDDLHKVVRFMKPGKEGCVEYLKKVALTANSLRTGKQSKNPKKGSPDITDDLDAAFNSAVSKYPSPQEQWNSRTFLRDMIKIKEQYVIDIKQEIIKDLLSVHKGETETSLQGVVDDFLKIKIK